MATDPTSLPTVANIQQAKKDMLDINTFNVSNSDSFTDNVGKQKKTMQGIENDARTRVSQVMTDLGINGIKVLIQLSTDPLPNPLEYGEGQPLKFEDTLDEFTLLNGAWVENGNVGDEVEVTAASHLTLAQAQVSDLRVGQYVRLTDFNNALYLVVDINDTEGLYKPLNGTQKLKLNFSTDIQSSWYGNARDDLQAVLNAVPTGGLEVIVDTDVFITSTVTAPISGTKITVKKGFALINQVSTQIAVKFTGAGCEFTGRITNPPVFDGTNAPITYAVLWAVGDGHKFIRAQIDNVPRVGIYFEEANDGQVAFCDIDGGTEEGFFNGANTVHFGVAVDCSPSNPQGKFILMGNNVKRCVQGMGSGSTGAPTYEQSFAVNGNNFELCWNHGYYTSGLANGHALTGNTFTGCQIPIALTGKNHVVDGNPMTVQSTGTGALTDNEITGISFRDPVNCVCTNNPIKGEGTVNGVVIGFDENPLVPSPIEDKVIRGNICQGNTIEITNTDVASVVMVRMYSPTHGLIDNEVSTNVLKGPVRQFDGLISLQGNGAGSYDNSVVDNQLTMTGDGGNGNFVLLTDVNDTTLDLNRMRVAYTPVAPRVHVGIGLVNSSGNILGLNKMKKWSGLTDVELRGVVESGTSSDNDICLTGLQGCDVETILAPNGSRVNGVTTGNPEGRLVAGVGSEVTRKDGGVGTTKYVKESGSSNTGWVAK